jgi:hypothetical protein
MKKTYLARCHCGACAFEADLDLTLGTKRCNCSFCRKTRNWAAYGTPDDLRMTADGGLRFYDAQGNGTNAHGFCGICGVRLFSRGDIPEMGGPFLAVMLSTLESATPEELIEAPLTWCDGAADNWWEPPAETRHL